jgi:hypothetical protein
MTLPQIGEIQNDLRHSFEILFIQERLVGPSKENVSAKVLARNECPDLENRSGMGR